MNSSFLGEKSSSTKGSILYYFLSILEKRPKVLRGEEAMKKEKGLE